MNTLLSQIETDLTAAIKSKNSLALATLRGLKSRWHNETIVAGRELSEAEAIAVIRSEIKRRKEAVAAYHSGGRSELADKELAEAEILKTYLPQEPTEEEITAYIDQLLATESPQRGDFGKTMGKLKAQFPAADGAALAEILKAKLKF
jgi:hypothetical protein